MSKNFSDWGSLVVKNVLILLFFMCWTNKDTQGYFLTLTMWYINRWLLRDTVKNKSFCSTTLRRCFKRNWRNVFRLKLQKLRAYPPLLELAVLIKKEHKHIALLNNRVYVESMTKSSSCRELVTGCIQKRYLSNCLTHSRLFYRLWHHRFSW